MPRLPGEVDGRRFLRALARFGWTVIGQRGSHRKLADREGTRTVIVAFHSVVRRNTIRKVLKQAGIDEDEFLTRL